MPPLDNPSPFEQRKRARVESAIYQTPARAAVVETVEDLLCPVEFRYGRDEVRSLFSRRTRLERALAVEAALAASEAELGRIPREAAQGIERAATSGAVTVDRVDEVEKAVHHDVMAVVRVLAEAAGEAGGWVHYGATSADITETALALEIRDAIRVLRLDLTHLASALLKLARDYRDTPAVGRTHGQHAVPLSFGYKMATAAAEVVRQRQRLDQLTPRVTVGKMAGAVGTGAGFGDQADAIEAGVMRRLGIAAEEAPSQLVGRDRLAEFTNFLALLAGTAERLSTEVRNLQRTEIGEAAEPFDERLQVGSSTMAQKRNPILSENVTSLARLLRAFALPPLENMALWHERDLAQSANERIVVPHAVVLADDILTKLVTIFQGLHVDVERLKRNLDLSQGAVMTENLMLALTMRGLTRQDAHELLRELTREDGSGRSLADRARSDDRVTRVLRPGELEDILDPASYVRASAQKTDRLLRDLSRELER
jgi:adenylosuccinate lyase